MKNNYKLFILLFFASHLISCVQETREITVSFEVDMRNIDQISSVSIIGALPPLSWREHAPMTDEDHDGIYDGTFTFDIPYDAIDYKYVLNKQQIELEGKANRRVFVKNQKNIIVRSVFDVLSFEHIKPLSNH